MRIRRLVIDVLKPHEPSVLEYADKVTAVPGVDGVFINVVEIDEQTESIEIAVEGKDLDYERIKGVIEELGGSVHSIDRVYAGSTLIKPPDHRTESR